MGGYGKNRAWTAVAYPEGMVPSWRSEIDALLQLPFAYAVHNADTLENGDERKEHVHIIIVFPGPTTYKHAMEVFSRLDAPRKRAVNTCEPVYNMQRMWDYLIHDTEDCKKKNKRLYPPEARLTGNNFDIGALVQFTQTDKNEMFDDLVKLVFERRLRNFADFVEAAYSEFPDRFSICRDVIRGWSGYFERLLRGVYHKEDLKARYGEEGDIGNEGAEGNGEASN